MKPDLNLTPSRRTQRGVVVIELAAMCLMLFILLLGTFLLGRAVWQYNVVAAAASQGVRYLSTGPWSPERLSAAEQLIVQMASEAGVSGVTFDDPICLPSSCGNSASQMMLLTVNVPFNDPTGYAWKDGIGITTVKVTVPGVH